jgi:hypothetical protein
MKKLFIVSLLLLSCQKSDIKKVMQLSSRVQFTASFVNELHKGGCDTISIIVSGNDSFSFQTYNNPCLNTSFGFTTWHEDTLTKLPYVIVSDRDTVENGLLTFTKSGFKVTI